jgi:hypothetical protein
MRPLDTASTTFSCTRAPARRGFTLAEGALVTVIVGVGVIGMLELMAAGTTSNSDATEVTTAINLAHNVREVLLGLPVYDPQDTHTGKPHPQTGIIDAKLWDTREATLKAYDNLLDFDGSVDTADKPNDPPEGYLKISPPIDVRREPLPNYASWAQWVKVETVASDTVFSVRPQNTIEPTVRVTVKMMRDGREVYRMSWLAVLPKPLF